MEPVKAHVKNGRLMLDEPTDLPEGQVVYLKPVEGLVSEASEAMDQRDAEDRAALHAELEASITEADSGQTEDFSKFLVELRRQP
jgi:hypothetical protein